MKTFNLMLNDLVYNKSNDVIKVRQVTKKKIGYHIKDNECNMHYLRGVVISGIPITEEILLKNGFVDYGETFDYTWKENGERYNFYIRKMYNKDNICDAWSNSCCGVLPTMFFFVHELQHALRIVGLNKLADNFII